MASIDSVFICNMALSHIGAKSYIESLAEQTAEAKQCKMWYQFSLVQCLEAFDWSFARKRDQLAPASDAPPAQWSYRYQYPADCVAMRRLWNPAGEQADAVPYEIETQNSTGIKTILTDMGYATEFPSVAPPCGAVGVYTFLNNVPATYTVFFVELLSRCIASHIAFSLTGKDKVVQAQTNAYQQVLRAAPAYDANERVGQPPRDAEWIRGRTFYYPYPAPPYTRGQ